jgi:predicted dehydrogenase
MGTLRAAVVGAGSMGRHHIRLLSRMPEVELVTVVDADPSRAQALSSGTGAQALADLGALPDIDFAVVAVPTAAHHDVALELIARGTHLLVEKPLASSPEEADALVAAAEAAGVVLAAGHVERYNPAIRCLARLVEQPLLMQFERLSPYTPRIAESIVFDLMVHDLDLACFMAGGYPDRVSASGLRVFSDTLDVASAVLAFPSGCVTSLQASRATQDKVRRVAISERERFLLADTLRGEVSIKRETTGSYDDDALYRQASVVEIPYLDRRDEPLALELADFVAAVRGEASPVVDGRAAARVVTLAHEVEAAAGAA